MGKIVDNGQNRGQNLLALEAMKLETGSKLEVWVRQLRKDKVES